MKTVLPGIRLRFSVPRLRRSVFLLPYLLSPISYLLFLSPAVAALDFTLQHKMLPADGISLDEVYITDGDSRIYLRFPPDWKVFNSAQALDFTPGASGARVRLEGFPTGKVLTIDEASGRALSQQQAALLPREATKIETLPTELSPLPIFAWQTMEVSFRYEYFGQVLRRSVMYLNMLPGRVVQMSVVAAEADFDKIHKEARQILSSWFEPSRDLPPSLQQKYGAPMQPGN